MQFEHPAYASPFYPPGPGYGYASPPPGGMPPRSGFYESGFGSSIPTPAPSPRTPSASRRRPQDFAGSAEYVHHKRPSSSRRTGHEHSEFPHEQYHTSTQSPRPGAGHRTAYMNPTPLHTPPPSAHAHHSTMPNIYSYVPGFTPQQAEYFPQSFTPGPQSPPPTRGEEGRRSRSTRRTSTWAAGEHTPRSPPVGHESKPKFSRSQTEPAPTDTDSVRRKAAEQGIPADYSLKNWDPEERPIILLGSVFDANSLGEWIFNWTKYHHGRAHDATKTAGGLWELLIELSSKLKRAREFFGMIKAPENREILDDFMESGERLWQKLKTLLKACEEYMWRGARGVASPGPQDKPAVQMGKRSGAEFVDAMFNGEKEWERTERLMRGMATWCQRFEVNCEDILRRPDA
ncbi:hypothetical protein Q9L58_002634 [Maublancomyces gigas]|uniref:Vegetative cell wall protein gp1 n=1 Tax=Discina gigas TaxID=1032678 RepID=A0ABR3GQW2_9PEZI